ncbi:MAG: tetratricopeptide repeat protein [Dehalococcoidia bacterium]
MSDDWDFLEFWAIHGAIERLSDDVLQAASGIVASVDAVADRLQGLHREVLNQTRIIEHGFASVEAFEQFQQHTLEKISYQLANPRQQGALEYLAEAQAYLRAKRNYDRALECLQRSVALYPLSCAAHYLLARMHFAIRGDHEAAWASCEDALEAAEVRLKQDPGEDGANYFSSKAVLLMGQMLDDGGSRARCRAYYEAACRLSPDYGECFGRYASIGARMRDTDLALTALRIAILIDEDEAYRALEDPGFANVQPQVRRLFDSMKQEAVAGTGQIMDELHPAMARLGSLIDAAESIPEGFQDETIVGELRESRASLAGDLSRAVPSERSAVPLHDALRERHAIFLVVSRLFSLQRRMARDVTRLVESARTASAEWLKEARGWAQENAESAERSLENSHGSGCAVLFYAFFNVVLTLSLVGFWLGWPEQTRPERFLVALTLVLIGCMAFSWIMILRSRIEHATWISRIRRQGRNFEEVHAGGLAAAAATEASLGNLREAIQRLRSTYTAFPAEDEITCTIMILNGGSGTTAGRDNQQLIAKLQELVDEVTSSRNAAPFSRDIGSLLANLPAPFLSELRIADAEHIARQLREGYGLAVGVKRRFVGTLPIGRLGKGV